MHSTYFAARRNNAARPFARVTGHPAPPIVTHQLEILPSPPILDSDIQEVSVHGPQIELPAIELLDQFLDGDDHDDG